MRLSRTLILFALLVPASVAFAEALVSVEVARADGSVANGKVVLVSGEQRYECTTEEGHCDIDHVPGGRYQVILEVPGAEPSPQRTVMIPPSGRVALRVAAP